jgi:hypothetical protein
VDNHRPGTGYFIIYRCQYPPNGEKKSGRKAGLRRNKKENTGAYSVVPQKQLIRFRLRYPLLS